METSIYLGSGDCSLSTHYKEVIWEIDPFEMYTLVFLSDPFTFAGRSWRLCFGQHGLMGDDAPHHHHHHHHRGWVQPPSDSNKDLGYGFLLVLVDSSCDHSSNHNSKVEVDATFRLLCGTTSNGVPYIERKRKEPFVFSRSSTRQRGIFSFTSLETITKNLISSQQDAAPSVLRLSVQLQLIQHTDGGIASPLKKTPGDEFPKDRHGIYGPVVDRDEEYTDDRVADDPFERFVFLPKKEVSELTCHMPTSTSDEGDNFMSIAIPQKINKGEAITCVRPLVGLSPPARVASHLGCFSLGEGDGREDDDIEEIASPYIRVGTSGFLYSLPEESTDTSNSHHKSFRTHVRKLVRTRTLSFGDLSLCSSSSGASSSSGSAVGVQLRPSSSSLSDNADANDSGSASVITDHDIIDIDDDYDNNDNDGDGDDHHHIVGNILTTTVTNGTTTTAAGNQKRCYTDDTDYHHHHHRHLHEQTWSQDKNTASTTTTPAVCDCAGLATAASRSTSATTISTVDDYNLPLPSSTSQLTARDKAILRSKHSASAAGVRQRPKKQLAAKAAFTTLAAAYCGYACCHASTLLQCATRDLSSTDEDEEEEDDEEDEYEKNTAKKEKKEDMEQMKEQETDKEEENKEERKESTGGALPRSAHDYMTNTEKASSFDDLHHPIISNDDDDVDDEDDRTTSSSIVPFSSETDGDKKPTNKQQPNVIGTPSSSSCLEKEEEDVHRQGGGRGGGSGGGSGRGSEEGGGCYPRSISSFLAPLGVLGGCYDPYNTATTSDSDPPTPSPPPPPMISTEAGGDDNISTGEDDDAASVLPLGVKEPARKPPVLGRRMKTLQHEKELQKQLKERPNTVLTTVSDEIDHHLGNPLQLVPPRVLMHDPLSKDEDTTTSSTTTADMTTTDIMMKYTVGASGAPDSSSSTPGTRTEDTSAKSPALRVSIPAPGYREYGDQTAAPFAVAKTGGPDTDTTPGSAAAHCGGRGVRRTSLTKAKVSAHSALLQSDWSTLLELEKEEAEGGEEGGGEEQEEGATDHGIDLLLLLEEQDEDDGGMEVVVSGGVNVNKEGSSSSSQPPRLPLLQLLTSKDELIVAGGERRPRTFLTSKSATIDETPAPTVSTTTSTTSSAVTTMSPASPPSQISPSSPPATTRSGDHDYSSNSGGLCETVKIHDLNPVARRRVRTSRSASHPFMLLRRAAKEMPHLQLDMPDPAEQDDAVHARTAHIDTTTMHDDAMNADTIHFDTIYAVVEEEGYGNHRDGGGGGGGGGGDGGNVSDGDPRQMHPPPSFSENPLAAVAPKEAGKPARKVAPPPLQ